MPKKKEEFSLGKFYADKDSCCTTSVFIQRPLIQYAEGYAKYRYDTTGIIMSTPYVIREAAHQYLNMVLEKIPTEGGYKLPDHLIAMRSRGRECNLEPVRVTLPRHTHRYIKQAIDFGYIYAHFDKPTFSACMRDALALHYNKHHAQLTAYLNRNPWRIL